MADQFQAVAVVGAAAVPVHISDDVMAGQFSSTAQDMAPRKPSEIDHLNGFAARRGRERGVPTPVNETIHALVKLVEAGYCSS